MSIKESVCIPDLFNHLLCLAINQAATIYQVTVI